MAKRTKISGVGIVLTLFFLVWALLGGRTPALGAITNDEDSGEDQPPPLPQPRMSEDEFYARMRNPELWE